jgi:hypothetical protein
MNPKYIRYKNVPLVGAGYENRTEWVKKMNLETNVVLRKKPNRYDENAFLTFIEMDGVSLPVGFIPKNVSKKLAYCLDNDYQIMKVLTRSIQRQPQFTNGNGHKTIYTFNMDILITNQNIERIRTEREKYLSNLEYGGNRFYFKSIFEQELTKRFLLIKKQLPLYQFEERDDSYFKKINKRKFFTREFLVHLGFTDFAAPIGPVTDFLNFLEIGITVENNDYKLNLFYKGYPLRDSDLISDFMMISNTTTEELLTLYDFDNFNQTFLKL